MSFFFFFGDPNHLNLALSVGLSVTLSVCSLVEWSFWEFSKTLKIGFEKLYVRITILWQHLLLFCGCVLCISYPPKCWPLHFFLKLPKNKKLANISCDNQYIYLAVLLYCTLVSSLHSFRQFLTNRQTDWPVNEWYAPRSLKLTFYYLGRNTKKLI